jgi:agmatine/peptidylarginine deiminase
MSPSHETTMTETAAPTPRDDAFAMPAEWAPHALTLFTYGGGGPHCITQQVPRGRPVPHA